MSEQYIESLSEYVNAMCELNQKLIRNGADKNERLLFRGQSDIGFELIPE